MTEEQRKIVAELCTPWKFAGGGTYEIIVKMIENIEYRHQQELTNQKEEIFNTAKHIVSEYFNSNTHPIIEQLSEEEDKYK